jgi:hypothetical protein
VIVSFVDIDGNVDHHCLEVIVSSVEIDGIVDYHCLEVCLNSDGQHFHQYQQKNNHLSPYLTEYKN